MMKQISVCALALVLALALVPAACSSKKEPAVKIAAGTHVYQLAKDAAKILPALDPEKNTVLITAKAFDVTVGEVLQLFTESMGNRADQFKSLDAKNMKTVIERAALQIGERKLLLGAATEAKKIVSPEEIKAAIDAQYARAGGEAQYLEYLKTNGLSLDFIKKGITEDTAIQKYLEGIMAASGPVSEAEIQKAYQDDKTATVRHILFLTQGKTPAEKAEILKKAKDILARAKNGEDFAALAKEYTEDPGSKENGGLYEDFSHGKMVKPFEDAAFSVPVSQISGIVETTYGYHILKVENRKKETQPLDQVRPQIEAALKQQK